MPNDLEKALDSLPGWVIPVTIGGVVLVAMFSKDNSRSQSYTTAVYGPQPTDPGIISLAQSEIAAKQGVYTTALNAFISRDISAGENDRDVHLASIGASTENARTAAAERVATYGLTTDQIIERIRATSALDLSRDQGATAKYIARKGAQSSIWGSVLNFGSNVARAFSRR